MNKEAVQHERGPRNSTIRKQMTDYISSNQSPFLRNLPIFHHSPRVPLLHPSPPFPHQKLPSKLSPPSSPIGSLVPSLVPTPTNDDVVDVASIYNSMTPPPSPEARTTNVHETAAKILFNNAEFFKNSLLAAGLNQTQRVTVFKQIWRKLFIISCAQFMSSTELEQLLAKDPDHLGIFIKSIGIIRTLCLSQQDYLLVKTSLLHTSLVTSLGPSLEPTPTNDEVEDVASISIYNLFFKDYVYNNEDLEKLVLNMI